MSNRGTAHKETSGEGRFIIFCKGSIAFGPRKIQLSLDPSVLDDKAIGKTRLMMLLPKTSHQSDTT